MTPNYNAAELDRQFDDLLNRRGAVMKPLTIRTLIHRARQGGYDGSMHQGTPNRASLTTLTLGRGRIRLPQNPPPPRSYTWKPVLVPGTLAVLAGPGGTSKTQLALQLATHVVCGLPWAYKDTMQGAAMLFLCEEDHDEISRRLGASARNLTPLQYGIVEQHLLAFPLAGADIRLSRLENQNAVPTGVYREIIRLAKEHSNACGHPVRLIVVDHARLVLGGDPNAADHVTELTRVLTHIAQETGATVLLLAHSPKSTLNKGDEVNAADVAGSAALVDNSRCTMVLTTMFAEEAKKYGCEKTRNQYACLRIVKNNKGPTGEQIWFVRRHDPDFEVATLEPIQLLPVTGTLGIRGQALDGRIVRLVSDNPGQLSKSKLRDKYSGKDGALRASAKDVVTAVERLLVAGDLKLRPPTAEERHEHGLHQNVKEILVAKVSD